MLTSRGLDTNPLYCDGEPVHRLAYLTVQLSLTALFLSVDLDFCVCMPYCAISFLEVSCTTHHVVDEFGTPIS